MSTTATRPTRRPDDHGTVITTPRRAVEPEATRSGGHHVRTGESVCATARAHQQDLVHAHPAVAERHRAADEVEPPDAHDLLADELGEPSRLASKLLIQPATVST